MDDLERRISQIEVRMERNNRHLLDVMATHREQISKSLDQVQIALMEQHMTIRSHLLRSEEAIRTHILSNEETMKEFMREITGALSAFNQRLERLEKPPAA